RGFYLCCPVAISDLAVVYVHDRYTHYKGHRFVQVSLRAFHIRLPVVNHKIRSTPLKHEVERIYQQQQFIEPRRPVSYFAGCAATCALPRCAGRESLTKNAATTPTAATIAGTRTATLTTCNSRSEACFA